MSPNPIRREEAPDGARFYAVLALLALLAAALPLLLRGLELWALFPSLLGALALAARWRSGPALYLLALLWVGVADRIGVSPWEMLEFVAVALVRLIHQDPAVSMHRSLAPPRMEEQVPLLDMFQAVAVLIYVAGHYRFLGVTRNLFPLDRRRRVRRPDPERPGRVVLGPVLEQKRSPEAVDPQEVGPLILVGAVCACLGQLLWLWVSARSARRDLDGLRYRGININIDRGLWQLAVLLWLFSLLLVVAAGVIAYLGQRRLTADEAGLYLQDELWRQTRREQSRINRWLAWGTRNDARRKAEREGRPAPAPKTSPQKPS